MSAPTFIEHLRSLRDTDTPTGDFVTDALQDPDFPPVNTWLDLRRYLEGRGAHADTLSVALTLFRSFELIRHLEGDAA
jgi:hypothetical protein